jgi:hypothetical protein
MKITRRQLRQIIQEELCRLNEAEVSPKDLLFKLIKSVQKSINVTLSTDVMAPTIGPQDALNYTLRVDLSDKAYPITTVVEQSDDKAENTELTTVVINTFTGDPAYKSTMDALEKKYSSFPIPITVIPPAYKKVERFDFPED